MKPRQPNISRNCALRSWQRDTWRLPKWIDNWSLRLVDSIQIPRQKDLGQKMESMFLPQIFLSCKESSQLSDWPTVRKNRQRPAAMVEERNPLVVDAQVPKHRGPKIVGSQRAVLGMLAAGVGRAHRLPHLQAASGNQHRHGVGPMISAGLFDFCLCADRVFDAGRSTEFTRDDKEHPPIQAASVKVFDESGDRAVVIS